MRPERSTGMTGMGEHRVPLLGSAWRRNDDPATSRDPQVRAVVGALATLPAPELNAEFRAELRAQLVAITPRIIAESAQTGRMIDIVPSAAPARALGSRPKYVKTSPMSVSRSTTAVS